MSELNPKDGSNDLEVTLINGAIVKVCRQFNGDVKVGRMWCSDNCPHMRIQEYEAGPMERAVLVWGCKLFNKDFPYMQGWKRNYYMSTRNPLCLDKDPEFARFDTAMVKQFKKHHIEGGDAPMNLTNNHQLVDTKLVNKD